MGRRASLLLPTKQEPLAVSEDEIFRSVVGPRRRRRTWGERTRNRPSNRPSSSSDHRWPPPVFSMQGAAVALSPSVLSTFTTTPRRARTPRRPRPSRAITPRLVRGAFQPSEETPGRPPNQSHLRIIRVIRHSRIALAAVAQSASTSSSRMWAMNVLPLGSSGTGRATRISRFAEM